MPVPTLPTPGDSEDVWGDILNAAITEVAEAVDEVASDVGDKADAADVVHRYGDETVEGAKTFVEPVTALSGPVSDQHLVTKKYVDDAVGEADGGVSSVNGQTGDVSLDAGDVGALPGDYTPDWDDLANKPSAFPPAAHNHDDRYYTESEVDSLLGGKAAASHTHDVGDLNVTGTPDGTKFLRDDGAWAAPPSSGYDPNEESVTIGEDARAGTNNAVSIGRMANNNGGGVSEQTVAVGSKTRAEEYRSIAIGSGAGVRSGASNALAIGSATTVLEGHFNAIAIGRGAVSKGPDTALIRSKSLEVDSVSGDSVLILRSPDRSRWAISVDDSGAISATAL